MPMDHIGGARCASPEEKAEDGRDSQVLESLDHGRQVARGKLPRSGPAIAHGVISWGKA